tara:strand:+ start:149 stop:733 length:585 start_codon:yes stop_codon:yes gene_type:complete
MNEELLSLLKKCAYRHGEFILSSGKTSEHYINCKPVILTGRGLDLVSNIFLDYIDDDVKAVAGLTLGADPLVSGVAMASHLWNRRLIGGLIVRKEPKGHGTNAWIEGPVLPEGSKVVVLEDVITTGASAIKAAQKVREAGYVVDTIISIVDRQEHEEVDNAMAHHKLALKSIFVLDNIIRDDNDSEYTHDSEGC